MIDHSFRSLLPLIIDAGWRRRWLLIMPVATMLIIGLIAAALWPGGYTARSLVMLHERSSGNPLAKETSLPSPEGMEETVKGLRALLLSDHVLGQVTSDIASPGDMRSSAEKIRDLRQSLSLELRGTDFLEFRLEGAHSAGLGRQLQAIMARFIETLLFQRGTSLGEFLLGRRFEELQAAEQTYRELKDQLDTILRGLVDLGQLELQRQRIINEKEKVTREQQASGAAARVQGSNNTLAGLEQKTQEIDSAIAEFRSNRDARERLRERVQEAARIRDSIQSTYDEERRRLATSIINRSGNLIAAPERIVIVDPPIDPEFRSRSRIYVIIGSMLAGALLGAVLALAAELLDDTIRHPHQLAAAGVPVIGRLPRVGLMRRSAAPKLLESEV